MIKFSGYKKLQSLAQPFKMYGTEPQLNEPLGVFSINQGSTVH